MPRRLILSDLHLGQRQALLTHPAAIERLTGELQWADEVIINGDLLSLVGATWDEAVTAAKPVCAHIASHVDKVRLTPGNHDHHLQVLAADHQRQAHAFGRRWQCPAQRVLNALFPDTDVQLSWPWLELDGVVLVHGTQFGAHITRTGWHRLDDRIWAHDRAEGEGTVLEADDYEASTGPLLEMLYQIKQSPAGLRGRRDLDLVGQVVRAYLNAGVNPRRRVAALSRLVVGLLGRPEHLRLRGSDLFCGAAAEGLSACGLTSGRVVLSHTHQAHGARQIPAGRGFEFYNTGSWVVDDWLLALEPDRSWPGTALRWHADGDLELVRLMDDLSRDDLLALRAAG